MKGNLADSLLLVGGRILFVKIFMSYQWFCPDSGVHLINPNLTVCSLDSCLQLPQWCPSLRMHQSSQVISLSADLFIPVKWRVGNKLYLSHQQLTTLQLHWYLLLYCGEGTENWKIYCPGSHGASGCHHMTGAQGGHGICGCRFQGECRHPIRKHSIGQHLD